MSSAWATATVASSMIGRSVAGVRSGDAVSLTPVALVSAVDGDGAADGTDGDVGLASRDALLVVTGDTFLLGTKPLRTRCRKSTSTTMRAVSIAAS